MKFLTFSFFKFIPSADNSPTNLLVNKQGLNGLQSIHHVANGLAKPFYHFGDIYWLLVVSNTHP